MRASVLAVVFAVVTLAVSITIVVRAQDNQQEAPVDARVLAYDKGPAKIDVSKYPPRMREIYGKLFSKKCAACHKLSRPINCDFVLEEEWERCIEQMMKKSGRGISAEEGKQIYDFLVYDSKVRKKALYEERLARSITP